jgi:hypothetical protein
LVHWKRIFCCGEPPFKKLAAIGHAPHRGHFTSRLSISITMSAPRLSPISANELKWAAFQK